MSVCTDRCSKSEWVEAPPPPARLRPWLAQPHLTLLQAGRFARFAYLRLKLADIIGALKVHPEQCGCTEIAFQPHSGVSRYAPALLDDSGNALWRNSQRSGQSTGGKAELGQFLTRHSPGVDRAHSVFHCTCRLSWRTSTRVSPRRPRFSWKYCIV